MERWQAFCTVLETTCASRLYYEATYNTDQEFSWQVNEKLKRDARH